MSPAPLTPERVRELTVQYRPAPQFKPAKPAPNPAKRGRRLGGSLRPAIENLLANTKMNHSEIARAVGCTRRYVLIAIRNAKSEARKEGAA